MRVEMPLEVHPRNSSAKGKMIPNGISANKEYLISI